MNTRLTLLTTLALSLPIPPVSAEPSKGSPNTVGQAGQTLTQEAKLAQAVIPSFYFVDVTLEQGLDFLKQRTLEIGGKSGGVNFVIEDPTHTLGGKKIKWLNLKNVSSRDALGYMLSICGAKARFDANAVTILALGTGGAVDTRTSTQKDVAAVAAKNREANFAKVVIPSVAFEEVPLSDGLDFFAQRKVELDKKAAPLNFVVLDQENMLSKTAKALRLKNVPVSVALSYFLAQCGADARYEANAIVIGPRGGPAEDTRTEVQKTLDDAATQKRQTALARIIIPSINFEDVPLGEAIDFLRTRTGDGQDAQGINFVVEDPTGALADKKVKSLRLKNIPFTDALAYIVRECGATATAEPYAVVIRPNKP